MGGALRGDVTGVVTLATVKKYHVVPHPIGGADGFPQDSVEGLSLRYT